MTKATEDDFLKTLKEGVRSVLSDTESTPAEKMAAITAGTRILQAEGKIKPEKDNGRPNFFKT